MCGATSEQKDLEQQQSKFYQNMNENYTSVYGKNQKILDAMTAQFLPILQAGPNQPGFSAKELEDLQTQAIQGTATNYANASRALNENAAATTGGEFLPSGAATQGQQELATAAAGTKSAIESGITQSNYAQGRANWQAAAQALGLTAEQYNPIGYAGAATGAGTAAANTANQIAQANNSVWGSVLGALGGVAGAAVGSPTAMTGLTNLFKHGGGAGGASPGGGVNWGQYGTGGYGGF